MYKCLDCGHIFEDGEEATWSESRGEYHGVPCSEVVYGCPICRGVFAKTVKCEICGSEHLEEELVSGVCAECIEQGNNIETCYNISLCDVVNVKVNTFLASVLSEEKINDILKDYVEKNKNEINCRKFIDEDIEWFCHMLKEVKK